MNWRRLRRITAGLAALLFVLLVAALVLVQTGWFRDYVRQQIVTATEDATGGVVEIQAFGFDLWRLRATIAGFVIHGSEPPGAMPFLRVANAVIEFRLFPAVNHFYEITWLGVDSPQVNVIARADGSTNIPSPKRNTSSSTTALRDVVDLAVRHFELTNGVATLESRKQSLNVRGNNLTARLAYNSARQSYQGQLSLQPVYFAFGRKTPVDISVRLPVTIGRDRISIEGGSLSTAASRVAFNVSVENIRNPDIGGRVGGYIALSDVENLTGLPVALRGRGAPSDIAIDVSATASSERIDVQALQASVGQSGIEGSGTLKSPDRKGALAFRTKIALGEAGRALDISLKPEGLVLIDGNASIGPGNLYEVSGKIDAENVLFNRLRERRVGGVNLISTFRADPRTLVFDDLRLTALGGEFSGNATLRNFEEYELNGGLRHLDLRTLLRAAGRETPYVGSISGPIRAMGDLKIPGTRSLAGMANLSITSGPGGIPVSGRLNVNYSGAADTVDVADSHIDLPRTKVAFNGAVSRELNVALTSSDLHELLAAASIKGNDPVALNGGKLKFNGVVSGGFANPRVAGHVTVDHFVVEGRQFEALQADLAAAGSEVAASNVNLRRGKMQAQLSASLGLKRWAPSSDKPIMAAVSIKDADLADVVVMAGEPAGDFSGALTATARISGTLGNPRGTVSLQVANGSIESEPFDELQAQANLTDQQVTLPAASIKSAAGQLDLTAEYQHPRDRFTTGQLQAHVWSTPINLAEIRQIGAERPLLSGIVRISGDLNGSVIDNSGLEFQIGSLTGDLSAQGLTVRGIDYGAATATARTSGQTLTYNVALTSPQSGLRLNGNTKLIRDYPTTADAEVMNLDIHDLLVLADREDIEARGRLGGTVHFDGTVSKPQGSVDLNLSRAEIYGQPIDAAQIRGSWLDRNIEVSRIVVSSGPARITLAGAYDHANGNLLQGNAQFDMTAAGVNLNRIHYLQKLSPGIGGAIELSAKGAAQVRGANRKILLTALNASLAAKNIEAQGKVLGDLSLTANTNKSSQLDFALASGLGGALIQGHGSATLAGDYPATGQLTFSNVLYSRWQPLFATISSTLGAGRGFDAATDGEISMSGPLFNADQLRGSLRLTRLNLTTTSVPGTAKPVIINNQGPIAADVDRGVVRIESAHLTGPDTDISASGTASLSGSGLNLTLKARTSLGVLPNFDPEIYAAGGVTAAATVQGSFASPLIDGQLSLSNAAFNYAGITNGISNANGVIAFTGNNATIRTLTAESGGGKVVFNGSVSYSSVFRFGIEANATGVRVRPQAGVSVTIAAGVRLTGTARNSVVSGNVSINQFSYNPKSDIGSILSRATPPVGAPITNSALLNGMRLEILVRSAAGVAVQASLAQNVQADVDLRVRGTAAQPAVLGRITINEGQLLFFGVTYTVDNGTISFYNPVTIQPVLDVSLETTAQGVRVTLKVTGPIDNMKLSYTSDPPLQFQEIVALLAAGQTPASDPTLVANQPQTAPQSFQQMGESAILTQGLANPVANQLQRVFGVTQLKIAPAFQTGTTQLPTARVTVQQQISGNVTFTYTAALDDPNGMIVQIAWAFSPQYSAVATRDQNGIFSLNFYYRRHFR